MDEIIYVISKVQFDFALEVWFSIYSLKRKTQKSAAIMLGCIKIVC